MRILIKDGYCLKHKDQSKFLNDADEITEIPQIFNTRSLAIMTKNVSSFGDKYRVKKVEMVYVVEE